MNLVSVAKGVYENGGVVRRNLFCKTCGIVVAGRAYGWSWPLFRCVKCEGTDLFTLTEREWKVKGYKKNMTIIWSNE